MAILLSSSRIIFFLCGSSHKYSAIWLKIQMRKQMYKVQERKKVMKTRSISVKVFGQEHELLAAFPCSLATDLLTLVDAFRRDKQVRLSQDRVSAVEAELLKLDSSLQTVRHQIDALKRSVRDSFDANSYYDAKRASAYSEEFSEVQSRHTSRCLYLLSRPSIPPNSVVLDLGCGSGLSTSELIPHFGFTIGLDASDAMLSTATASLSRNADFIHADFNHTLPFRTQAFDFCSSTSALHYVRPSNTSAFLNNLLSVVKFRTGAQLFCRGGVAELKTVWMDNWKGTSAFIVADRPHHKQDRFYLSLCSEGVLETLTCPTVRNEGGGCELFEEGCRCLLQVDGEWKLLDESGGHKTWLENEHGRHLNRLRRLQRRADREENA